MADRYWVGGAGTWNTTTTHWSASSGGAAGETAPGSGDNVFFDLHSNEATDAAFTCSMSGALSCKNLSISFVGTTKIQF
ncbi:MAG: hypothetical protein NUV80_04670, partial [Candidatus Berkelbacteria bacterium]|nr:hypothetical protein [Candidatus Berkelbacteria bacterium]